MLFAGVVGAVIGGMESRAAADDVEAWFATHPAGAAERKVAQVRHWSWFTTLRTYAARVDECRFRLTWCASRLHDRHHLHPTFLHSALRPRAAVSGARTS